MALLRGALRLTMVKTGPQWLCRRNAGSQYTKEVEAAVNQQIITELEAGMAYLSMACFYGRTNVALPGCQTYFTLMYEEEQQHTKDLIDYQLKRGGAIHLCSITVPDDQNWGAICKAFTVALEMEKIVKEKLGALHCVAEKCHDLHMMDFIVSHFIRQQTDSISEIARLLTRAQKMSESCIGEFLFDKELFETCSKTKACKSEYK